MEPNALPQGRPDTVCDLVVLAPHPDDAEIHAGGLIAAHVRQGRRVAVIDATRGELGSRGTPQDRAREAAAAAEILGLCARVNLGLPDGGIRGDDPAQRLVLVAALRRLRPRTVIALHGHARHPDHQELARLVAGAAKAAALHGLVSDAPALPGLRLWLVEAELPIPHATLLVPCSTADWQRKMAAVRCYGSQLAGGTGPTTTISEPTFLTWIEARGRAWGQHAESAYAEALSGPECLRIADLTGL